MRQKSYDFCYEQNPQIKFSRSTNLAVPLELAGGFEGVFEMAGRWWV